MKRIPFLLSLIAGMVDVIGYLTLGKLFTAHVTGNIVVMGAALAGGILPSLPQMLAVPMFALAVAGAWFVGQACTRYGVPTMRVLLSIEFLLLISVLVLAIFASPSIHPGGFAAGAAAMLAMIAMGCQFVLSRLTLPDAPSPSVMTGNLVSSVLFLLSHDARAGRSISVLVGFFGGCVIAAIAVGLLKDSAWALPACLAGLALAEREQRP